MKYTFPFSDKTNLSKRKSGKKIASGEYGMGVLVLEMDCTKQLLSTNGITEKRTSQLTARKYLLDEIRKKSLVRNSKFLKLVTDESYNYNNISRKIKWQD
jgi:hypothetical protein